MKRTFFLVLIALCIGMMFTGCSTAAEQHTGEAQGYGGVLRVAVRLDSGRIIDVQVLQHNETPGVGTLAIDALPAAIVRAGSTEVDDVSGATYTSQAIKKAVQQAISPDAQPTQPAAAAPDNGVRSGTGISAVGRLGPGTDAEGQPIYSLNITAASGMFDPEGRIVQLTVDQLEVASPNAESKGLAVFSGWPDTKAAEDTLLTQPADWPTKRQRGGSYRLGSGSWAEEMDAYQRLFTGMTVDEVERWFAVNCSPATGRPLRADAQGDDLARYNALDDDARARLADVTASATMSLRDEHGDIITAIRRAWEDASQG